jgi:hypothetical protein
MLKAPHPLDALWTLAVPRCGMFRRLVNSALDNAAHLLTLARLRLYDWMAGPPPETPTDRAIREEGERLRKALPEIDFDDPTPRRNPPR